MPKGIKYKDGYIYAGNINAQITPNFKAREFLDRNNNLYIHRELVSTLQEIRDDYGASIKISGVNSKLGLGKRHKGLFAWLKANDLQGLRTIIEGYKKQGFVTRMVEKSKQIYVQVPEEKDLPAIPANFALERAIILTSAYETTGDPFQQVTGNFDGAGLSFGPLQVNLKTRTFHTMFNNFITLDEELLKSCFDKLEHYYELQSILQMGLKKQIKWADDHSIGKDKHGFKQPWKSYFKKIGRQPEFRNEMLRFAYDKYGRVLLKQLSWLNGLWPIKINQFSALASLYDLCVQQGGLEKGHDNIRKRVLFEKTQYRN